MDEVSLSALIAAVTVLGSKVYERVASEAGKELWTKVKNKIGAEDELDVASVPREVTRFVESNPEKVQTLIEMMQNGEGITAELMKSVSAEKVVIANRIDTVNM